MAREVTVGLTGIRNIMIILCHKHVFSVRHPYQPCTTHYIEHTSQYKHPTPHRNMWLFKRTQKVQERIETFQVIFT